MRRLITVLLGLAFAATGVAEGGPLQQWPNWRGPTCSGAGDEYDGELVRDLSQAKLLWRSEDPSPSTTSMVVGNDRFLIISGYYGPDSLWDISGDKLECLSQHEVPRYATGLSGALVAGLLYYRETTNMACLDLRMR